MERALSVFQRESLDIVPVQVGKAVTNGEHGEVQERRVESRIPGGKTSLESGLVGHLHRTVVILPETPYQVVVGRRSEGRKHALGPLDMAMLLLGTRAAHGPGVDVVVGGGTKEPGPPGGLVKGVVPPRAQELAGPDILARLNLLVEERL